MNRIPGNKLLPALLLALLCVFPAWAETATQPAMPQVSAKLVFDKPSYFLGENILAHFGITNTGDKNVTIDTGGDYRGSPRALRFKVTAVDATGYTVEDPYVYCVNFGGLVGEHSLKPGETFWDTLSLPHYCDFTAPGTYTVHVSHDLGWAAHQWTPPEAVGTLTLRQPTARQATVVVAGMVSLPHDPGWTDGQRRAPYVDFSVMRYSAYLPPLLALAQAGDKRALEGIAAIRTPEATRALMNLTAHINRAIADGARQALLARLPSPPLSWNSNLRRLSSWSWSGHLEADVRKIGWRLLASADRQQMIDGAVIIRNLGEPADLPRLAEIFDRVLTAMKDDPTEQSTYPRPWTACSTLVNAGEAIVVRGGRFSITQSTAQDIYLLCAVKYDPQYRPTGWQSVALRLLKHPIPFVRATALEKLPFPLDPAFIDQVSALMHDKSPLPQAAALSVAYHATADRFGQDALQVLATATDQNIVQSAFLTAESRGIPKDQVLEKCIDRLDEPSMTTILFELIMRSVLIVEHGSQGTSKTITSEEARRLKVRWQSFVTENREALRAGKKFPFDVPPVTEDLMLAGYHLCRKDGSVWPVKQDER